MTTLYAAEGNGGRSVGIFGPTDTTIIIVMELGGYEGSGRREAGEEAGGGGGREFSASNFSETNRGGGKIQNPDYLRSPWSTIFAVRFT
jgi:hypothetical protein